jgi:hypothetical protein
MLRIIRPKETSGMAVVTGSERVKWGQSEKYKDDNGDLLADSHNILNSY